MHPHPPWVLWQSTDFFCWTSWSQLAPEFAGTVSCPRLETAVKKAALVKARGWVADRSQHLKYIQTVIIAQDLLCCHLVVSLVRKAILCYQEE
ncbi:hypothetical protein Y1Q_0007182 [Alligator mississippiensis]|uniref:Uncharacterized protein n=1 Tax=Alligator mississippiensis TaxID=8496 RepID=A0A151N653_ALLMI|nr:hypothetical protein Y1Q_0007182 [Alligator mississippiensis]